MKRICVFLLLVLSFLPVSALAAEMEMHTIEQELKRLETDAVDDAAEQMDAEIGFTELLQDMLWGEFDFTFSSWKEKLADAAFGEFRLQG